MEAMNFLNMETLEKCLKAVLAIAIFVAIAKSLTWAIKRIFKKITANTSNIETKKQIGTLRAILTSTVNGIIYALLLFHILNILGVDIRPLLATAGVMGVAIGFGSKRFVEDIISGLLIVFGQQARVGDVVEINKIQGTVERINLRMITLRTSDGTVHYIRNGLVDVIANSTCDYSVAIFEIGVSYDSDVKKITGILKELGEEIANNGKYASVILEPLEILGLDRFENSAMIIKCQIKTLPSKHWPVKRAFNLMVKEKFDELGIIMPYPHITIVTGS